VFFDVIGVIKISFQFSTQTHYNTCISNVYT